MAVRRVTRLMFLSMAALVVASATADVSIRASAPALEQAGRVDVLILFASHPGAADVDEVRRLGGNIKHAYRIVPAVAASLPGPAVEALRRNPRVMAVDPDVEITALDVELDNAWGVKHIGAGSVHAAGNKGAGVTVAVLDTGIDYDHPDLDANYLDGYDFVNGDADPLDDNGHGTHVAGTIAAEDNDVDSGVVGVAPQARLIALKVLGASKTGSFSDVVAALEWLVDFKEDHPGEYVANHSYGSNLDPGLTVVMAFHNAYAEGILHVAAAGDNGTCAGKGAGIGFPALYESVISVAAVDTNNNRACFSSVGADAELSAPGVGILSTSPGGAYALSSGTSMASAHLAGVGALVLSGGVADTNGNGRLNDDVRTALAASADDLGVTGRDTWYGYGLVDAVAANALEFPPTPLSTIDVVSIAYRINNNRGTKTLVSTVTVVDGSDEPVRLARVTVTIRRNGVVVGGGTQLSATNGEAIFWITNPPSGTYTTTVDVVDFPYLSWNGVTPVNQYVKN